MVEFLVGLIPVIAIIAAFLQVTALSSSQTDTLVDARQEAGDKAMGFGSAVFLETDAEFIKTWSEGPDGMRHTPDDEPVRGIAGAFTDGVIEKTSETPEGWLLLGEIPDNPMVFLRGSMNPSAAFGLVKGEASEMVPVLSAVKKLLYRADSITVSSTVWLTGCSDLY